MKITIEGGAKDHIIECDSYILVFNEPDAVGVIQDIHCTEDDAINLCNETMEGAECLMNMINGRTDELI